MKDTIKKQLATLRGQRTRERNARAEVLAKLGASETKLAQVSEQLCRSENLLAESRAKEAQLSRDVQTYMELESRRLLTLAEDNAIIEALAGSPFGEISPDVAVRRMVESANDAHALADATPELAVAMNSMSLAEAREKIESSGGTLVVEPTTISSRSARLFTEARL